MTRQTIGGTLLTDHDLVAATSASRVRDFEDAGKRLYIATWDDDTQKVFAVGHAEAAQVFAREYSARIKADGARLVSVRWMR